MLSYPARPEGTAEEQVWQLWELLWKIVEEINLLEEDLQRERRDSSLRSE